MIRSADLRPGDTLIDATGRRVELWKRGADSLGRRGWEPRYVGQPFIPDHDINLSGNRRRWWLDESVPR